MRQYMLLIQHGDMPKPGSPEWAGLSADEQKAIYAEAVVARFGGRLVERYVEP